jgi:hypothetical protein
MGLRCTMPKCRTVINAWTGFQEIEKLQKHFLNKHKISLTMDAALKAREAMEAGFVPIRMHR